MYKTQIVTLEAKAHEAWLLSRNYERKVEELRSESMILRKRLTNLAEFQPNFNENNRKYIAA